LNEKDRKMLQQTAHTCPVLKSLHPEIKVSVAFHWE
jgi:putative redox protein